VRAVPREHPADTAAAAHPGVHCHLPLRSVPGGTIRPRSAPRCGRDDRAAVALNGSGPPAGERILHAVGVA